MLRGVLCCGVRSPGLTGSRWRLWVWVEFLSSAARYFTSCTQHSWSSLPLTFRDRLSYRAATNPHAGTSLLSFAASSSQSE